MKVSFALTLEGMVRALRGRLHDVAEQAQGRYADTGAQGPGTPRNKEERE